jgi:periplasmic copper chaperone A
VIRQNALHQPLGSILAFVFAILVQPVAAHVSVATKPVIAGKTQEIVLSVPHGCSEVIDGVSKSYDTLRVEVQIPSTLGSLRPLDAVFGPATIEKNTAEVITKIIWTKPDVADKGADSHHYNFAIRAKVNAGPFTTVYLPTTQYCKNANGNEISAAWTAISADHHDHSASAAENPAPSFIAYPARTNGWNKYVAPDHLHDMSIFSDAQIVWKATAGYSANPNTAALISADTQYSILSEIHPGEEFWVKY